MPFEKGQSGNPNGRPKTNRAVVELARAKTEKAISVLVEIMDDVSANASSRVAASQAILDRGWGKPTQLIGGDEDAAPIYHEVRRTIVTHKPNDSGS